MSGRAANRWIVACSLLGALSLAEAVVIASLWHRIPDTKPGASAGPTPMQGASAASDALGPVEPAEAPNAAAAGTAVAPPFEVTHDLPSLEKTVQTLSDEALAGRMVGTPGEAAAAQQIAAWFDAIGLPPPPDAKRVEPFAFTWEGAEIRSAGNVLAYHDAHAPWTVIVGAHYDHIGLGHSMSREYFTEAIHPGADDNASGVAVLLELARTFAKDKRPAPVNLLFAAFSGEEEGLFGARSFLKSPAFDESHTLAYINYDMVGRAETAQPVFEVEGPIEFPPFKKLLEDIPKHSLTLRPRPSRSAHGTDRMAFLQAGIPALSFSSGHHDDYHKPTDTPDRINVDGMRGMVEYTLTLIDALGGYLQGFDRSKVVRAP